MSVRTSHRLAAFAAPVVVAGLVLGACGGDSAGDAASKPTISLDTEVTQYQTIPPATTVPEVADSVPGEIDVSSAYIVQAGDFPLGVADKFDVSLEDIANLNGWGSCSVTSCGEFPGIGGEVLIPGGVPAAPVTDTETVTPDPTEADPGETGEAIPDPGGNCAAAKHIVVAGDIPLKLVELYDVTLDALTQANANNPAFGRFVPGDEIIIPAKADCVP